MRWFRFVPIVAFLAIVPGCGGIGGRAHEQRLVENLGLVSTDTREQMSLAEFSGDGGAWTLIGPTVFAVGWDPSHIIAKRHPTEEGRADKSRTEYFIVAVRNRKVYGPLDKAGFAAHCDILGVSPALGFSQTFSDLE